MDRLEEARADLPGDVPRELPSFEGRYYQVHEARNVPRPVQPGGPPILIGGGGEKRTLRLVARYADFCNITGDVDTIRHKVDVLRGHCEAVGRDPAAVTVSVLSTLVLTGSDEETAATKDFLRQVTGEEPTGSDVGTPDQLVARIEELAAAGVEYFVFNVPTGTPETVRRVGDAGSARCPADAAHAFGSDGSSGGCRDQGERSPVVGRAGKTVAGSDGGGIQRISLGRVQLGASSEWKSSGFRGTWAAWCRRTI